MAIVKEILSKDQLLAMKDFEIGETDKFLARVKELSEKFETLDKGDMKAQLDIVVESRYLNCKLDGMLLVMEELERLAKTSYSLMR